jgi:hypothetical protein
VAQVVELLLCKYKPQSLSLSLTHTHTHTHRSIYIFNIFISLLIWCIKL